MSKLATIIEEEPWDVLDFSNVTVRRNKWEGRDYSKVTVRPKPELVKFTTVCHAVDLLEPITIMRPMVIREPLLEIDLSKVTIRRR